MDEEAIRIHLLKIVSQLESGLTELSKITSSLRALIRTIDVVLLKLELQDGYHNINSAGDKCFYRWLTHDVNENVHPVLGENHWEAYASQDWFAGFKQFPRPKLTTLRALPEAPGTKQESKTFYLQVSEVLLQIESILHSLEKNALTGDNFREISVKRYVEYPVKTDVPSCHPPALPFALPPSGEKIAVLDDELADEIFDTDPPYYQLNADVLGDYEDKVDDALENVTGNYSEDESFSQDSETSVSSYSISLPSTLERTNNRVVPCELENYFD